MSSADGPEPPVNVDRPALGRWPTFALDNDVEAVGSDGARCTIYPPDAPEESRLTAWIAATGDAFVGLDEIR